MTTTFDLTANELKAALVLVRECLNGMGGQRPSDLDNDPYTWCDAQTLINAGWSKEAAAGTYGSLAEKGFIFLDREGDTVSTAGYQFIDTIWDAQTETKETEMTVVLVDIANLKVEFHADPAAAQAKADKQDLIYVGKPEDLGEALTGPQMVALYNATAAELNTGLAPVTRFATKEAAVKRTMANLTDLWELRRTMEKAQAKPEKAAPKAKPATGTAPRRGTGINLAPMKKAYACRAGSKQAILVDMLSREQGATMEELLEALSGGSKPWKEVSVKSGMNWDMNKVKGYGIRTTKRGDDDCYHLVLPEGLTAPVPHTEKKGA
jgi:hypothetical protein